MAALGDNFGLRGAAALGRSVHLGAAPRAPSRTWPWGRARGGAGVGSGRSEARPRETLLWSSRLLVLVASAGVLAGQTWTGAPLIDKAIEDAIAQKQMPGAVVLIGQQGETLHYRAYGQRAQTPAAEAMTAGTIFDAASLTKVIATTSAVMKLVEQGKLRLNDPVTRYLPEFQGGKSDITVRHLLIHYSGLRPDVDIEPPWSGYETGIRLALIDKPAAEPGQKFVYSDINFVLLGEMVRVLSGKTLPDFVRDEVFAPLGMKDTAFQPPAAWRAGIAPTEQYKGMSEPLRGVVHDPTARYMGGIAGHAGLFTTAADLQRFARMMLGEGALDGVRIFSPLTVKRFTSPATPGNMTAVRGLGWDIDSPFAGQRGDVYPVGGFGHTGFTGTSIWMDPATQSYVILMANAVHPYRRPAITSLRSRVASIAAAHLSSPVAALGAPVLNGIDVLASEGFARLKGKRVGLATNHTGFTASGERDVDAMRAAGVNLTALFSPEHGLLGKEDHDNIGNANDAATGLPVYSLYEGERRKPKPEMLNGIDVMVFDMQDIGTRFYTYGCTMKSTMEAVAERNIPIVVLDRPNPITGEHVEGPMMEKQHESFVGCEALPLRHGMTIGELALLMNSRAVKPADLSVVQMKGWRRDAWFDQLGQSWVNPSPNMKSLNAALLYPGIGMLEYAKNWSVGRGTDAPFEQVGADWVNGPQLAQHLNAKNVPGVRAYATRFTPTAYYFAKQTIEGVRFVVTNRDVFDSSRLGLELAQSLRELYPGKISFEINARLIGHQETIVGLTKGESARGIRQSWRAEMAAFQEQRARFLLYR